MSLEQFASCDNTFNNNSYPRSLSRSQLMDKMPIPVYKHLDWLRIIIDYHTPDALIPVKEYHFIPSFLWQYSIVWTFCYFVFQVIEISEYRATLYDYLKNRMMAIAPNLTVMVGELVGARLIAHAGMLQFWISVLFVCSILYYNYLGD